MVLAATRTQDQERLILHRPNVPFTGKYGYCRLNTAVAGGAGARGRVGRARAAPDEIGKQARVGIHAHLNPAVGSSS
jgi:hypothetical protein